MGKTRAAVVLFVDTDDEVFEARDLAAYVRQGLFQAGLYGPDKSLPVTFQGNVININIVTTMDIGEAAGNGYLWTNVTSKAFCERGRYTEKEKKQIIDDILEGSYEESKLEK